MWWLTSYLLWSTASTSGTAFASRPGLSFGKLTMSSKCRPAPCFAEAELVIECRKMYWADFDPANFLDAAIRSHYPARDYHRMYYGEVVSISGEDAYRR